MNLVDGAATVKDKHRGKRPLEIPFPPVEGNIPALKKYLIDSFTDTVFCKRKIP